jgi:undecaprenyl-diphosphatase
MTPRTSRDLLIAAGVLAGVFVALLLYVRYHGPIPGDRAAIEYSRDHALHHQRTYDLYTFLGVLGTPAIGLLTTLTIAVVVFTNVGARAAGLVLVSALIVLLEHPLSLGIGATDAAAQLGVSGNSFPSGHALFATSVYGMTAVLGRRHGRPEAVFIAVVLIVAIALQRVVTGAHLVNEVIGGALLGGAWLCTVLAIDAR